MNLTRMSKPAEEEEEVVKPCWALWIWIGSKVIECVVRFFSVVTFFLIRGLSLRIVMHTWRFLLKRKEVIRIDDFFDGASR